MEELYNALEAGRFEVVHDHLDSLMQTMPPADDWNYGNVCHHYLTLFGLLGLYESNDLERAKNSLRLAGQVESSPQLVSFGPNMLLARALLARGERATVETYLEDCKSLWLSGAPTLDGWLEQIRQNQGSRLRRESRILTKNSVTKILCH